MFLRNNLFCCRKGGLLWRARMVSLEQESTACGDARPRPTAVVPDFVPVCFVSYFVT